MSINIIISIAMLVVGVVLVVRGLSAIESFSSDLSRFFTESPSNKAIWQLAGGAVVSLLGGIGIFTNLIGIGA